MTKQDFEVFAGWFRIYPHLLQDYDFIDDLMDWCSRRNKNFDHKRFLLACGFEEEEIQEIWDYDED